jgi:hypothetical protein
MRIHRISLLLAGSLAVLAGHRPGEAAASLDPKDLLGSIRRLQRSHTPEATAMVRQIENGPHALALQRAAARREGIPLTPAELQPPSPPSTLDAAPVYARLMRGLRERPLDSRAEAIASGLGTQTAHTPEELAVVRKLLDERREVMDLIHQAADKPQCVFRRDWALGLGVVFPEQFFIRKAERLLKAESYFLAQEGRYPEAITNQARGFRLAEHVASDPTLIAYLVGLACDALTLDGMKEILYLAGPNAAVADQVRMAIATYRPRFSLRRVLRGEVLIDLVSIDTLRRAGPEGLAELLTGNSSARRRRPTPAERRLCNALWDAAAADYLRQMRRAFALTERPASARLSLFQQFDQQFAFRYSSSTNSPVRLVLAILTEVYSRPVLSGMRSDARAEVVIAGAAVLAYKARHTVLSDRLEEALPQPPLDPFSGEPLRYRREGDGFVVYSVGPGRKFDGGKPGEPLGGRQIYFRYPAPPRDHSSLPRTPNPA